MQNGLAERAIRTITKDVRTALSESGLPHSYWAAAAAAAVYPRNLMPTSRHPDRIPVAMFEGKCMPVSVAHLRVWGSYCTAKTPVVNGQ